WPPSRRATNAAKSQACKDLRETYSLHGLATKVTHAVSSFGSAHCSHRVASASLGMRQSPRGERLMLPTLGPSGRQDRLNWLAKNRRMKTFSQRRSSAGEYSRSKRACPARNRIFSGGAP